jgi:type III secretion protein T
MGSLMEYESFTQAATSFAVVLPRIAAAFLLIPYFTTDTITPMIRNVFFVSLALAVMPLALAQPIPTSVSGTALIPIILKEILIGLAIGYTFSVVFWALEGAGQIIDSKIGATSAQLVDPITGQQSTLLGAYLGRLAGYIFAAFGGLTLFVDLLLSSFAVWPVLARFPDLSAAGSIFFVERFDELMRLMLLLAAPALSVLTLLEFGLGFMNRYAPQLNVFTLSMPLKSLLAVLILLLAVGTTADFVVHWLAGQRDLLRLLPL